MMSKLRWGIAGMPGAWRPHLMCYDMDGIPIYSGPADDNTTTYSKLVRICSHGSPAPGF